MDESFLTDLLECSVCFHQLDTTSKVLPCQHTFCRRCLDGIMATQKELRCPECRILVDMRVDELPSNILLIRLLDGLKNNPKINCNISTNHSNNLLRTNNNINLTSQSMDFVTSNQRVSGHTDTGVAIRNQPNYHHHSAQHIGNITASQQHSISLVKQIISAPNVSRAKALYNYEGKEPGDLCFKKGDIVTLKKRIDTNWFHGELEGKQGFLPASYVQILGPPPTPVSPQCKALYDFRVADVEEKDCLSFNKHEVITVIRRVDDNWAEGKLGERIGIFPISFVEMNSTAKSLMKLPTVNINGTPRTAPPTPGAPTEPTTSATMPPASMSIANESSVSVINSTPNLSPTSDACTPSSTSTSSLAMILPTVIPFSPTSMQTNCTSSATSASTVTSPPTSETTQPILSRNFPHKPPSANQKRHSLCAVSAISIGVPTVLHRTNHLSTESTNPHHRHSMEILSNESSSDNNWPPDLIRNVSTRNSCRHQPSGYSTPRGALGHSSPVPTYYVAMYNYKPQKTDEIELKKSELYTVTEKCQDGWFKGTSLRTGVSGVFPGNYVQLSKSSLPQAQFNASIRQSKNLVANSQGIVQHSQALGCRLKSSVSRPNELERGTVNVSLQPANSSPATCMNTVTTTTSIYARPRPISSQNRSSVHIHQSSLAAGLLDWARSFTSPPQRPVRLNQNGDDDDNSAENSSRSNNSSSSSSSSPSLQWHKPKVAATRNMPPSNTNVSRSQSSPTSATGPDNSKASSENSNTGKTPDKKDPKRERMSLMKRWTSKRRTKSPPANNTFSCDNPTFVDTSPQSQVNAIMNTPSTSGIPAVHVRSGSCPSEVLSGSQNRKKSSSSSSLTTSNPSADKANKAKQQQPVAPPLLRERYRCLVPYPPNSDYELELQLDDVVYVHKKRDDGWFKGTLQRTGRTGLFPGSFVESF